MNIGGSVLAAVLAIVPAQWYQHPTQGIPRLADGKPDLAAPVPRTADGKPDLSGIWQTASSYVTDIAKDLQPGTIPFQPWAETLFSQRLETHGTQDPTAACVVGGVPRSNVVPYPFKIVQTPGLVLILYEAIHHYRQIFTDGREFPVDPDPAWLGYSVGHWEGNEFVVRTTGFHDDAWLDNGGKPGTDQMEVTERFRRKDFGHMEVEVTIDDPKAYTRPWTVTIPYLLQADTELAEYMCNENNRYFEVIPK